MFGYARDGWDGMGLSCIGGLVDVDFSSIFTPFYPRVTTKGHSTPPIYPVNAYQPKIRSIACMKIHVCNKKHEYNGDGG